MILILPLILLFGGSIDVDTSNYDPSGTGGDNYDDTSISSTTPFQRYIKHVQYQLWYNNNNYPVIAFTAMIREGSSLV